MIFNTKAHHQLHILRLKGRKPLVHFITHHHPHHRHLLGHGQLVIFTTLQDPSVCCVIWFDTLPGTLARPGLNLRDDVSCHQ